MLHIHKNVDGTYYINLEVRDSEGHVTMKFHGNFEKVDDAEREQDLEHKFEINAHVG